MEEIQEVTRVLDGFKTGRTRSGRRFRPVAAKRTAKRVVRKIISKEVTRVLNVVLQLDQKPAELVQEEDSGISKENNGVSSNGKICRG